MSGMNVGFHGVAAIFISRRRLESVKTEVRNIVVLDKNGEKLEITLFGSEDPHSLDIVEAGDANSSATDLQYQIREDLRAAEKAKIIAYYEAEKVQAAAIQAHPAVEVTPGPNDMECSATTCAECPRHCDFQQDMKGL